MRPLFYVLSALAVMGLAFWAYRQNYATQHAIRQVAQLQREIAKLHDSIQMQQAEWAYENRPSRLRELALLNFAKLDLLPMAPEQFGTIAEVAYPQVPEVVPEDAPGPKPRPASLPAAAAAVKSATPKSGAAQSGARSAPPMKIENTQLTSASGKAKTK